MVFWCFAKCFCWLFSDAFPRCFFRCCSGAVLVLIWCVSGFLLLYLCFSGALLVLSWGFFGVCPVFPGAFLMLLWLHFCCFSVALSGACPCFPDAFLVLFWWLFWCFFGVFLIALSDAFRLLYLTTSPYFSECFPGPVLVLFWCLSGALRVSFWFCSVPVPVLFDAFQVLVWWFFRAFSGAFLAFFFLVIFLVCFLLFVWSFARAYLVLFWCFLRWFSGAVLALFWWCFPGADLMLLRCFPNNVFLVLSWCSFGTCLVFSAGFLLFFSCFVGAFLMLFWFFCCFSGVLVVLLVLFWCFFLVFPGAFSSKRLSFYNLKWQQLLKQNHQGQKKL